MMVTVISVIANVLVFLTAFAMTVFGKDQISWSTLSNFNTTSVGVTILLLQAVYTAESLKSVNLDEQAILLLYGAFVEDVHPGLVYVPWGFCTLLRAPTGIIEKDLPADPRYIWHGDATVGDGKVPSGYFPPNRVTFAPKPDETIKLAAHDKTTRAIPPDDAYLQRNTAEVEASYGWQINDLHKLAVRLGTKSTLSKAQSQMDDTAVGTFTDIFSRMTAAEAMTLLGATADQVRDALTIVSQDWGITVAFFRMKPLNFSHSLNGAVSLAAESLPRKIAVERASEGEKTRLTNLGVGNANAEKAMLLARAKGEAALAKVAETDSGKYAMAIQATQRGLETARAVIVPQGDLFGAAGGVAAMLKELAGTPEAPRVVLTDTPPAPTTTRDSRRRK